MNNTLQDPSPIVQLKALLKAGTVTTQADICAVFAQGGQHYSQSKVSRMLKKLGAVKHKNADGVVRYQLPKEPTPPATSATLSHLVIDIQANEHCIIITTSPGSASLIARVLDHEKDSLSILGTLAGDDTILVAPKTVKNLDQTITAIHRLLAS